jgi:GntR family transcriptional regulator, transcriptional repressor for pyruvate dehydrogenase complex
MEYDPPFEPIARETVSSQIRGQLLHRISTGELAPGSVMPSERDLSQRFEVARTSVREAMQGLVSIGAVERRGNRSYVVEHLPEVVLERPDDRKSFVSELFETRRVLEIPLFILATGRADDEQRDEVAALARRFDADLDIAVFRRLDRDFHTTVAASCANPVLIELYGKVLDLLFRSGEFDALLNAATNRPGVERIIADSAVRHRAIADAFVAGDPEAVRIAAEAHLSSVEQSMVEDLA